MTLKNILIGSALMLTIPAPVFAGDQSLVSFSGSLVNRVCTISSDSMNQTVELGSVAAHVLNSGYTSTPVRFSIKLEGCDPSILPDGGTEGVDELDTVHVTFIGPGAINYDGDEFTETKLLKTDLRNVGIELRNSSGDLIEFGESAADVDTSQLLVSGNNTLDFTAALSSTGADVGGGELSPHTMTIFNLSYD